jgi:predicted GNAT family N-acyltransferase
MSLKIESATKLDIGEIAAFIKVVYDNAIAPTYSDQGNHEFYKYIDLEAIDKRFNVDHWMLKALDDGKLVGIMEIRKNEHLSMLFVDSDHQRQGMGRKLLTAAISKIKAENPDQTTITTHSTPNAVPAYERLGFIRMSEEQNVNGIRFVTMEKTIN